MSQNTPSRTPDPTTHFGNEALQPRSGESVERPGVAKEHPAAAGAGERPPLAGKPIDSTPLKHRFERKEG